MAEYSNVLRLLRNRKALEQAWGRRISEDAAMKTVFAYLDETEMVLGSVDAEQG